MSAKNIELAVDVTKAYIAAHTKQIVASSVTTNYKETYMVDIDAINNVIKSVYKTLEELPEKPIEV